MPWRGLSGRWSGDDDPGSERGPAWLSARRHRLAAAAADVAAGSGRLNQKCESARACVHTSSGCCDSLLAMGTTDSLPDDVAALKALVIATQAELVAAQAKARNAEAEARAGASDRADEVRDRQAAPRAVRAILRARRVPRTARAAALPTWKRTRRKPRRAAQIAAAAANGNVVVQGFERQEARAAAAAGTSAARARRLSGAELVPAAAAGPAQDRRGCDRDAGGDPAPVEGDPACAREVLVPGLREDQPAAGALPSDCARPCRTNALAHILFAKYGLHLPLNRQSDGLRPRRHRSRRLDAGRLGRRLRGNADAAGRVHRGPCLCGRAHPCRRHARCRCWPRARRRTGRLWTYVRDDRPFGGPDPPAARVLLLARSRRRSIPSSIWRAMPD